MLSSVYQTDRRVVDCLLCFFKAPSPQKRGSSEREKKKVLQSLSEKEVFSTSYYCNAVLLTGRLSRKSAQKGIPEFVFVLFSLLYKKGDFLGLGGAGFGGGKGEKWRWINLSLPFRISLVVWSPSLSFGKENRKAFGGLTKAEGEKS